MFWGESLLSGIRNPRLRDGISPAHGFVRRLTNEGWRKIRKSGEFYAEVCEHKGATEEMIRKYFGA
jgi:hypothetical protein